MNSATLPRTGAWTLSRDEAIRSALKEQRGGVDIDRAPKQALELVIAANVPVKDHPALRGEGEEEVRTTRRAVDMVVSVLDQSGVP
jgi:hypothetical protein